MVSRDGFVNIFDFGSETSGSPLQQDEDLLTRDRL
jgi:hypothetical protein